jgi:hypothetical protein
VVIVAVVAVKLAVVLLAAIVTEAGTEKTLAIAPDKMTEAPLDGAALERVTVQPVLALEASDAAEHCTEEINVGAVSRILNVAEELLREAVIVAV